MNENTPDQVKTVEERVEACAHCGAENPPGLLMCLECGREPASGRDLFASPEVPMPGEGPTPEQLSPSQELIVTLPDPIQVPGPFIPSQELNVTLPDRIQVPDPLPIPTVEDFAALPPQQPGMLQPGVMPGARVLVSLPFWGGLLLYGSVLRLLFAHR